MPGWLTELLKETGLYYFLEWFSGFIRRTFEKNGAVMAKEVTEKAKERFKDERVKLEIALRYVNAQGQAIYRRIKAEAEVGLSPRVGSEEEFQHLLIKYLKGYDPTGDRREDGQLVWTSVLNYFLLNRNDDQRWEILYGVKHDFVEQKWEEVRRYASGIWQRVEPRIRDLWAAGNDWARWAIVIAFLWPVLIALVALLGSMALTAAVTLIGFLAGLGLMVMARFDPLILAAVGVVASGRRLLSRLALLLGLELLVGAYFALVPVATKPGFVPVVLVLFFGWFFLILGKGPQRLKSIVVATIVVITLNFFGVFGRIGSWTAASVASASPAATTRPAFRRCPASWTAFTVNTGEEKETADGPPHGKFNICATSSFLALAQSEADTSHIPWTMSAGYSNWQIGGKGGRLLVRGLTDQTTIYFQPQ